MVAHIYYGVCNSGKDQVFNKPDAQSLWQNTERSSMKKVLVICGSPRPDGNTAQIAQECAKVIENNGVSAEVISFAGKKIESCTACYQCKDLGECSIDDGLNTVIKKLRDSQGFIVASPVYFGTARGDVMSALQRIGMVSMASDSFLPGRSGDR
jgi:multimeric flavodoxin WrbA